MLSSSLHRASVAPLRRALRAYSGQPNAPVVSNLINGEEVQSTSSTLLPLHNPATQELVCYVPQSTPEELAAAEAAAAKAFETWRYTPVPRRQRVMFELQRLIR